MGASRRLVWVSGCGIDASFTPSGTRLDTPASAAARRPLFAYQNVLPLVDGGYLVRWDAHVNGAPQESDKLLRPDGSVLREVDGDVLDPWATDGTGRGPHVLRMGYETVAVDQDGDELWRADLQSIALLVRTPEVLVVADDALHLHGLDAATGQRRWLSERPLGAGGDRMYGSAEGTVQAAFTDGKVVAVVLPDWDSSNRRWVAFDLASGTPLWEREYTEGGWGAEFAVNGRIVRWSPNGLKGLG
jgi:outer membrane protein assembly factor BamB